jgi:hypothetical protein
VKSDKVVRVSLGPYTRAKRYSKQSGRELKEITDTALDEHVKRQQELAAKYKGA